MEPGVKKKALETVSFDQNEQYQQTVISSDSGAKILNNLESLADKLENLPHRPVKTLLGDISRAIGAQHHGSASQYATFETKNGRVVTIRLSDHNAHTSGFDHSGREDGISIVVSARQNNGINNDGSAHVIEYFYDAK